MKLRYTQRAARELSEISSYFLEHNPKAGEDFFSALDLLLGHLTAMPELGRMTQVEHVRVVVVPRYSYRIFYEVTPDALHVLSVFHTARDPGKAPAD